MKLDFKNYSIGAFHNKDLILKASNRFWNKTDVKKIQYLLILLNNPVNRKVSNDQIKDAILYLFIDCSTLLLIFCHILNFAFLLLHSGTFVFISCVLHSVTLLFVCGLTLLFVDR